MKAKFFDQVRVELLEADLKRDAGYEDALSRLEDFKAEVGEEGFEPKDQRVFDHYHTVALKYRRKAEKANVGAPTTVPEPAGAPKIERHDVPADPVLVTREDVAAPEKGQPETEVETGQKHMAADHALPAKEAKPQPAEAFIRAAYNGMARNIPNLVAPSEMPFLQRRADDALDIALAGNVRVYDDGVLVKSQTSETEYELNGGDCPCLDSPDTNCPILGLPTGGSRKACKHQLAVWLVLKAGKIGENATAIERKGERRGLAIVDGLPKEVPENEANGAKWTWLPAVGRKPHLVLRWRNAEVGGQVVVGTQSHENVGTIKRLTAFLSGFTVQYVVAR